MNQKTFLSDLEKNLNERNIDDIAGIVEEYDEHFKFKLADGYSEDEIAARLGSPQDIAAQYKPSGTGRPGGHHGMKALVAAGLSLLFIPALSVIILFFGWVIVLGALAVASAALGVLLIGGINPVDLIPFMPGFGAVIMGVCFLGLALLSGIGTVYCLRYAIQWVKAYFHWNRRCLALAAGRPAAPPIAATPQYTPRARRLLRRLTGLSLA
ncbi:MAG: DUF1700 domain-containing protein, partial [Bacillota bacterium]|nr:DUF1700 domain-containing protein [Bacillota bacterium]